MRSKRANPGQPYPVVAPAPGFEGATERSTDDAYVGLGFWAFWELTSLGLFVASLFSRWVASWLFPRPKSILWWVLVPILISLGGSAVGMIFGWVGTKRSRRPGLAKLGLFLNAVVFSLVLLLFLALVIYRYR